MGCSCACEALRGDAPWLSRLAGPKLLGRARLPGGGPLPSAGVGGSQPRGSSPCLAEIRQDAIVSESLRQGPAELIDLGGICLAGWKRQQRRGIIEILGTTRQHLHHGEVGG